MKVVASDFDNTLFVNNDEVLLENIKTVKEFIEKGYQFIIITGRSFTNIKKVLKEYNISYSYLVCQDGANLFDNQDNCIKSNLLSKEKAVILEKFLKENQLDYSFESAFSDYDTLDNAVKITVVVSDKEEALLITKKIKEIVDVYAYVSSRHINIIDNYVNKSSALQYLIDNNYIGNNITTIGDDINDYEMLEKYNGVIT